MMLSEGTHEGLPYQAYLDRACALLGWKPPETVDEAFKRRGETFGVVGELSVGLGVDIRRARTNWCYARRGHLAAAVGDLDSLAKVLESNDVDTHNFGQQVVSNTLFQAAVMAGSMESAVFLLERGANPNKSRFRKTSGAARDIRPVHYLGTAKWGDADPAKHAAMIRLLVERGVDLNAQTSYHDTPLSMALKIQSGAGDGNAGRLIAAGATPDVNPGTLGAALEYRLHCTHGATPASLLAVLPTMVGADDAMTTVATTMVQRLQGHGPANVAVLRALLGSRTHLVPAVHAVAMEVLESEWNGTRKVDTLTGLKVVLADLTALMESMPSSSVPVDAVTSAKRLLDTVQPALARITVMLLGSFSCLYVKVLCCSPPRKQMEVDLNDQLWTLQDRVYAEWPDLAGKDLLFRGPRVFDRGTDMMTSLDTLGVRDGYGVFVMTTGKPAKPVPKMPDCPPHHFIVFAAVDDPSNPVAYLEPDAPHVPVAIFEDGTTDDVKHSIGKAVGGTVKRLMFRGQTLPDNVSVKKTSLSKECFVFVTLQPPSAASGVSAGAGAAPDDGRI